MMDIGPYYKQPGYCNLNTRTLSAPIRPILPALEPLAQQANRQGEKFY